MIYIPILFYIVMFKFNIVAPKLINLKEEGAPLTDTPSQNLLYIQLLVIPYHLAHSPNIIITFSSEYQEFSKLILNS